MLEREARHFCRKSPGADDHYKQTAFYSDKNGLQAELCDLSERASINRIEELQLLKSGKKTALPNWREEDVLHRLFFRFINEFNRTEVPSLSCDDLEIDEAFDDWHRM